MNLFLIFYGCLVRQKFGASSSVVVDDLVGIGTCWWLWFMDDTIEAGIWLTEVSVSSYGSWVAV